MDVKNLALGIMATMGLMAFPATAQEQVCGERAVIVKQLETNHGEVRRSGGLQDNMVLVEVFASDQGSWTILYTKPSGISCFMAVGKSWEAETPKRSGTRTAL